MSNFGRNPKPAEPVLSSSLVQSNKAKGKGQRDPVCKIKTWNDEKGNILFELNIALDDAKLAAELALKYSDFLHRGLERVQGRSPSTDDSNPVK